MANVAEYRHLEKEDNIAGWGEKTPAIIRLTWDVSGSALKILFRGTVLMQS